MKSTAEREAVRGQAAVAALAAEHARLEAVFESLVANAQGDDRAALRADWARFERELGAHMDHEERQLFPRFSRFDAREALALRCEHASIREALAELGLDLDLHCLRAERVEAFVNLLRAHARREESLFHPWLAAQGGAPRSP